MNRMREWMTAERLQEAAAMGSDPELWAEAARAWTAIGEDGKAEACWLLRESAYQGNAWRASHTVQGAWGGEVTCDYASCRCGAGLRLVPTDAGFGSAWRDPAWQAAKRKRDDAICTMYDRGDWMGD